MWSNTTTSCFVTVLDSLLIMNSYVTRTNDQATIISHVCLILIVAFPFDCKMLLIENGHVEEVFIWVSPSPTANWEHLGFLEEKGHHLMYGKHSLIGV